MFGKEKVAIYIDGSNFYHYLKDKEISFPKGQKLEKQDNNRLEPYFVK